MSDPSAPMPPSDQPPSDSLPTVPTADSPLQPLIGWAIAAWCITYLLTWWFVIAGAVGRNLVIYQLALLALCGEGAYFFFTGAGWRSLVAWWRGRTSGQKVGVGCLTLCVWPLAFLILPFWPIRPIFRSAQTYYASTQQQPSQQAQAVWQRIRTGSRQFKIGAATVGLVGMCALCSTTGMVMGHPNPGFLSDDSTPTITQMANDGASSVPASNQAPTDSPTPSATDTPTVVPTATPIPKWTTIQTFTGNGNKKTPVFNISADTWRLVWSCNPSSSFGGSYNVIADVMYSDATPADYAAINTICKAGNTGDFTEEHVNGDLYLDINSEAAWTMEIQVLK